MGGDSGSSTQRSSSSRVRAPDPLSSSSSVNSGRPKKGTSASGARSWSKKTWASRPDTHSGLSLEASKSASAAGLARHGGFGGAAAASVIAEPFQISRRVSLPFFPIVKTDAVARGRRMSRSLSARS